MKLTVRKSATDSRRMSAVTPTSRVGSAVPRRTRLSATEGTGDGWKIWLGVGGVVAVILLIAVIASASGRRSNNRSTTQSAQQVQNPPQQAQGGISGMDQLGGKTMQEWCRENGATEELNQRKKRVIQHESGAGEIAGRKTR